MLQTPLQETPQEMYSYFSLLLASGNFVEAFGFSVGPGNSCCSWLFGFSFLNFLNSVPFVS